MVPAVLEFVALTLLYCLIPNCAVRWRDGALGALIATIAIEILKVGFSFYIGVSSFYQTVYGALAIIPIFLLWMYISWMAVLLGAVVAAALPNWRIDERVGTIPSGGVRLGFSLSLIASLARAQRRGESRSTPALAAELGVATTVIDEHLRPLAEAGFVAHTQEGCWVLVLGPETATLHDLYEALHLPLAGRWMGRAAQPWQRQVAPAMDRIVKAESCGHGRHDRLSSRRNARTRSPPARPLALGRGGGRRDDIGVGRVERSEPEEIGMTGRDRRDRAVRAVSAMARRSLAGRAERARDDLGDDDIGRQAVGSGGAVEGAR